jgi:hypothetical protein
MVIGTIVVIFGAMGIVGGLCGAVSPMIMKAITSAVPAGQEAIGSLEVMKRWSEWIVGNSLLRTALGTLLLAAGIGLLKQRSWARLTCLTWACARVAFAPVEAYVGHLMQVESLDQMARQGPSPPAAVMGVAFALGAFIGLAWAWALPVFMLVWLSRRKIREEVAGWR